MIRHNRPHSLTGLSTDSAQLSICQTVQDGIDKTAPVAELVQRYNRGERAYSLALQEGIRVESLFQRFRRAGYHWDVCLEQYTRTPLLTRNAYSYNSVPERVIQAILQCRGVKADRLSASLRLGFQTVEIMDEYMAGCGYRWCEERHCYMPMGS